MIKALLFFAVFSFAAPTPHPRPYWLTIYRLAPYRETWSGELEVKKLDAALPKIVSAVEEIIEHLANVEAVARSTEGEILWNITVKEAH